MVETGAADRLNEIDPTNGKRPIDVATGLAGWILIASGKGVDLNPTAMDCPLHRYYSRLNVTGIQTILDAMDYKQLNWADPTTGQTVLYLALDHFASPASARGWFYACKKTEALIMTVRADPNHACFAQRPYRSTPEGDAFHLLAYENWDIKLCRINCCISKRKRRPFAFRAFSVTPIAVPLPQIF